MSAHCRQALNSSTRSRKIFSPAGSSRCPVSKRGRRDGDERRPRHRLGLRGWASVTTIFYHSLLLVTFKSDIRGTTRHRRAFKIATGINDGCNRPRTSDVTEGCHSFPMAAPFFFDPQTKRPDDFRRRAASPSGLFTLSSSRNRRNRNRHTDCRTRSPSHSQAGRTNRSRNRNKATPSRRVRRQRLHTPAAFIHPCH